MESDIILNDFKTEFWTDETTKKKEFQESPDSRWARVTEDSLIMFSPQGTLCLRFLVDLLSEETQKMDDVQVRNDQPFGAKEGVFLWCQTISHLCGPRQLKQKLPNFGKGRDEELADFVETVERKRSYTFLAMNSVPLSVWKIRGNPISWNRCLNSAATRPASFLAKGLSQMNREK